MFYTTAWCVGSEEAFRKNIPLEILGESMRKFNTTMSVHVVILEGGELLSDNYRKSLQNFGIIFTDYSEAFKKIIEKFPAVNKQYSRYERNCFLRWIAIREIIEKEGRTAEQCWHIDSDIVLHASLDELAGDTKGKTFMLQGCPVLTSISDFKWFQQYEEQLSLLNNDITGFSQEAWNLKPELLKKDGPLLNLSYYRNPIGSDQDLLEYLIGSGKLIQDSRDKVYNSRFYFVQNALNIGFWHTDQAPANATFSMNDKGEILIANKRLPFVHYQNTFAAYAETYWYLKRAGLPEKLIKWLLAFKLKDDQFMIGFMYKAVNKLRYHLNMLTDRKKLMQSLTRKEEKINIISLLNFLLVQTK